MPCRSSPKRLLAPVIGSPSSLNASSQAPKIARPLGSRRSTTGRLCQSSLNGCALLARHLGELDEGCSRRLRSDDRDRDRGGEIEPRGLAVAPQIDPLRINAGHSPAWAAAAEQTMRVPRNRVAMVFVHMFQDLGFGRRERADIAREQKVAAVDPVDPAEARDEMPVLDLHPVEMEVAKAGVARTRRVMSDEARQAAPIIARQSAAEKGQAGPGERIE